MVIKEKKEKNILIKKTFGLQQSNKALGLIKISNKVLLKDLRDGLITLPVNFVIEIEGAPIEKIGNNIVATSKIDNKDLIGFDFVICDEETSNINKYLELGVTPIISKNNHMNSILKEFNPIKNDGNSFQYDTADKWSIFYTLVRYLENYKFPFDNKNLVKNVLAS